MFALRKCFHVFFENLPPGTVRDNIGDIRKRWTLGRSLSSCKPQTDKNAFSYEKRRRHSIYWTKSKTYILTISFFTCFFYHNVDRISNNQNSNLVERISFLQFLFSLTAGNVKDATLPVSILLFVYERELIRGGIVKAFWLLAEKKR